MPSNWQSKKQWVAKDDKKNEEVEPEVKPEPKKAPKEPKAPKGESKGGKGEPKTKKSTNKIPAEVEAAKPPPSPLLTEPPPGPSYDFAALLRIRTKAADEPAKQASFFGAMSSFFGGSAEATEEFLHLKQRPYKLEDRPPPATEEEKVPGARRAKKAERKASEEAVEPTPTPTVTVEASAPSAPEVPPTPSSLKIDLDKELPSKPDLPAPTPTSAAYQWQLDAYLTGMQYQAMQMQLATAMSAGMTTVMLRNIPNRYSREMLVQRLDEGYKGQFDFVYLPIDFNSKCNVGYAFINFLSPAQAQRFYGEFHNKNCKHCLPGFSSHKIVEVTFARVQGREANLENLKDEKFMSKLNEQPEWQPLFWENGVEVPFEKLLGESTGRKRAGSRMKPDMSPMAAMSPTASASFGFGFGMPTPAWNMYNTPTAPSPAEAAISLSNLVASVSDETSLMLRGIPKPYSRAEFLEVVDKDFKGSYDFVFLPMDPKAEGFENRAFAFINFREAEKGKAFTEKFHKAKPLEMFPLKEEAAKALEEKEKAPEKTKDEKKKAEELEVQVAKLKSLDELLNRFYERVVEDTKITPDWYPLLFDAEGNTKDFPMKSTSTSSSDKKKKKGDQKGEAPGGRMAATPKGKAKAKAKGKGQQPAYPPAYPGYYGYPGYPPMMGYSPYTHMAATSAACAQAAQFYANANYANTTGMMAELTAAVNPGRELDESNKGRLRKQLEYYFSTDNLCKDIYLRGNMDADGWVGLDLLTTFKKVEALGAPTSAQIAQVLADSKDIEVSGDGSKVRLKNEEDRKKFGPATPVPPKS